MASGFGRRAAVQAELYKETQQGGASKNASLGGVTNTRYNARKQRTSAIPPATENVSQSTFSRRTIGKVSNTGNRTSYRPHGASRGVGDSIRSKRSLALDHNQMSQMSSLTEHTGMFGSQQTKMTAQSGTFSQQTQGSQYSQAGSRIPLGQPSLSSTSYAQRQCNSSQNSRSTRGPFNDQRSGMEPHKNLASVASGISRGGMSSYANYPPAPQVLGVPLRPPDDIPKTPFQSYANPQARFTNTSKQYQSFANLHGGPSVASYSMGRPSVADACKTSQACMQSFASGSHRTSHAFQNTQDRSISSSSRSRMTHSQKFSSALEIADPRTLNSQSQSTTRPRVLYSQSQSTARPSVSFGAASSSAFSRSNVVHETPASNRHQADLDTQHLTQDDNSQERIRRFEEIMFAKMSRACSANATHLETKAAQFQEQLVQKANFLQEKMDQNLQEKIDRKATALEAQVNSGLQAIEENVEAANNTHEARVQFYEKKSQEIDGKIEKGMNAIQKACSSYSAKLQEFFTKNVHRAVAGIIGSYLPSKKGKEQSMTQTVKTATRAPSTKNRSPETVTDKSSQSESTKTVRSHKNRARESSRISDDVSLSPEPEKTVAREIQKTSDLTLFASQETFVSDCSSSKEVATRNTHSIGDQTERLVKRKIPKTSTPTVYASQESSLSKNASSRKRVSRDGAADEDKTGKNVGRKIQKKSSTFQASQDTSVSRRVPSRKSMSQDTSSVGYKSSKSTGPIAGEKSFKKDTSSKGRGSVVTVPDKPDRSKSSKSTHSKDKKTSKTTDGKQVKKETSKHVSSATKVQHKRDNRAPLSPLAFVRESKNTAPARSSVFVDSSPSKRSIVTPHISREKKRVYSDAPEHNRVTKRPRQRRQKTFLKRPTFFSDEDWGFLE